MRFNNKEMIHVSHSNPALEGRMSYAKMSNGYASKGFKERWFRLKYNLLFYFKINGFGQVDLHQPAGVFVLENSIVRLENNMPGTLFSFSLSFKDEPDKKYIISSQSEDHVHQWIKCIQSSTYEYMRTRMTSIQKKIVELTGRVCTIIICLLSVIFLVVYLRKYNILLQHPTNRIISAVCSKIKTNLSPGDPLLMYPEEGKKIGRTKRSVTDEDDSDLFFNPPTDPLPPPRHKHDASKTADSNLIEL